MVLLYIKYSFFLFISIFCSIKDVRSLKVDSILLYIGFIGCLCFSLFIHDVSITDIGLGIILLSALYFILNSNCKKSFGRGDIIYLSVGLVSFGCFTMVISFFLASWLAILYCLPRLIKKKLTKESKIAYIPFLFIAFVITTILRKVIDL